MSGLGAGHLREMPLDSGLEAGYAWLTQDKAESLWNLARGLDMSGLRGDFGGRIDFLMVCTSPTHPMYPS
jgi:hypothetical protein